MITKNLKKLSAGILCTSSNQNCFIPLVDDTGATVYASMPYASNSNGRYFPGVGAITSYVEATSIQGIMAGTGTTPPTEDDYSLESPLLSGASKTLTPVFSLDANGNPIVSVDITIPNTGDSPITVSEIGYIVNVRCSATSGGSSASNKRILLDRTLLSSPVTIPAGSSATITYTLTGVWNTGA